uniref:28S ribosomal protein S18c, mitochondrial n=1 Tax=Glossina brevipalpis TaxID=37001 RepID=A0A1A9WPQ5_9MUSC
MSYCYKQLFYCFSNTLETKMFKFTKFLADSGSVVNITKNVIRPIGKSASSATLIPAAVSNDPDEPIDIPNPYKKERVICILCKHNITPDHKNVKLLSQFQSPYTGRIYGRHITGLCKQKQAEVEAAILRAQSSALMPSYHKDIDFIKDPKLFNPEKPTRPHKY